MVAVIPHNVDYPSTDKASIKRAQLYREFRTVIDDVYSRLESGSSSGIELERLRACRLDLVSTMAWLDAAFRKNIAAYIALQLT
jgi:hypothetical protein